jgi:hypothetical protein
MQLSDFDTGYNYAKAHAKFWDVLTDSEVMALADLYSSLGSGFGQGMAWYAAEYLEGRC